MFESLGEKFDSLLRKLRGQGKITERNIEEALRDVRLALLEADVNLNVVRDFVEAVKHDALGAEVLRSLTPEQHFVKLVHRELVRLLGEKPAELALRGPPPLGGEPGRPQRPREATPTAQPPPLAPPPARP